MKTAAVDFPIDRGPALLSRDYTLCWYRDQEGHVKLRLVLDNWPLSYKQGWSMRNHRVSCDMRGWVDFR